MKKYIGLFILIIIILLFLLSRNKKVDSQLQSKKIVGPTAKTEHSNSYKSTEVNTEARMKKLLRMIDLSNVPVELYGIVVDENEKPISGAVVSWRVGQGGYSFASG